MKKFVYVTRKSNGARYCVTQQDYENGIEDFYLDGPVLESIEIVEEKQEPAETKKVYKRKKG